MPVIERSTSYSAVSCSAFLLCVARGELRCLTYTYLLGVIYVHPRSIKQGYKFGQLGMRRGTHFPKRRHLRRRVNLLPRRSAFEVWVLLGFLPPPRLAWQPLSRKNLFLLSFLLGGKCHCPFAAYQDANPCWPRGTKQWESCCVEQSHQPPACVSEEQRADRDMAELLWVIGCFLQKQGQRGGKAPLCSLNTLNSWVCYSIAENKAFLSPLLKLTSSFCSVQQL